MKTPLNGVTFMSLALEVLNVWFTSIWMEAILAPGKNVYHMVLSTSGLKLVLLEESEPNSPFIALTPLVLYDYFSGKGF